MGFIGIFYFFILTFWLIRSMIRLERNIQNMKRRKGQGEVHAWGKWMETHVNKKYKWVNGVFLIGYMASLAILAALWEPYIHSLGIQFYHAEEGNFFVTQGSFAIVSYIGWYLFLSLFLLLLCFYYQSLSIKKIVINTLLLNFIVAVLPVCFLAFDTYHYMTKEGLIINPLFSFQEEKKPWNQLKEIHIRTFISGKGRDENLILELHFSDDKVVEYRAYEDNVDIAKLAQLKKEVERYTRGKVEETFDLSPKAHQQWIKRFGGEPKKLQAYQILTHPKGGKP